MLGAKLAFSSQKQPSRFFLALAANYKNHHRPRPLPFLFSSSPQAEPPPRATLILCALTPSHRAQSLSTNHGQSHLCALVRPGLLLSSRQALLRRPQASHATTTAPHGPTSKSYASDFERRVDEVKVPKVYVILPPPLISCSSSGGLGTHPRNDVLNIKLGISLKIFM